MSHAMNRSATEAAASKMESSLLHRLLVFTDAFKRLPWWAVILIFLFNTFLIVEAFHQLRDRGESSAWGSILYYQAMTLQATQIGFGAMLTCGVSLWLLPRFKRSFGPYQPSAIALSFVITGVIISSLVWSRRDDILRVVFNTGVYTDTFMNEWSANLFIAYLIVLGIVLLVIYSTWREPFWLEVTHQSLKIDGWDTPFKILHLTDLHLERKTHREDKIQTIIDQLQPDLIVFTGDFVNLSNTFDPQTEQEIRQVIGRWTAPYGVYVVSGTPIVEPFERVKSFVSGLENLHFRPNQWSSLQTDGGTVHLFSMVTTHDLTADRNTVHTAQATQPPHAETPEIRLMLSHAPDVAPEAATAGFDLYLCGHTHGGQIRFPLIGALFSSSQLGKRFVMGRYSLASSTDRAMTLYTSRGIGMEGFGAPRARFLCRPEITLWTIHNS